MALTYSNGLPLGTPAPDFALPGVDGSVYTLASFADAAVLVVVFSCNHCPYVIATEDRFIALQKRFAYRGVRFVFINANDAAAYPEDSFEAMKRRAAEKGYPFPYLHDASQDVARAYDAACTPDIFVFDGARRLCYNGRIDDNWKDASAVTNEDLRTAIEDVLAGRAVTFPVLPSMGCNIKWRC